MSNAGVTAFRATPQGACHLHIAPDPFVHERQPHAQSVEREFRLNSQHVTSDLGGLVSLAKPRERRCQDPKRGGVARIFVPRRFWPGKRIHQTFQPRASEGHVPGSQPPRCHQDRTKLAAPRDVAGSFLSSKFTVRYPPKPRDLPMPPQAHARLKRAAA